MAPAEVVHGGALLADGGRAPTVLNGGLLEGFPPLNALAVLAFFVLRRARRRGAPDAAP